MDPREHGGPPPGPPHRARARHRAGVFVALRGRRLLARTDLGTSTAIVENGLRRSGFEALAEVVSVRVRALCEGSGSAENFDARTGAGLRDRAYTWTAAVYLLLAD